MLIGDELPLYNWENNPNNWEFGEVKKPFNKEEIIDFVNSNQNLVDDQQMRLMICLNASKETIGCIDLFEYDEIHKVAGVGILIGEEKYRNRGYAFEALNLLVTIAREQYLLTQLFCNISPSNTASIRLFEKSNFSFIEKRKLFDEVVNYYELNL